MWSRACWGAHRGSWWTDVARALAPAGSPPPRALSRAVLAPFHAPAGVCLPVHEVGDLQRPGPLIPALCYFAAVHSTPSADEGVGHALRLAPLRPPTPYSPQPRPHPPHPRHRCSTGFKDELAFAAAMLYKVTGRWCRRAGAPRRAAKAACMPVNGSMHWLAHKSSDRSTVNGCFPPFGRRPQLYCRRGAVQAGRGEVL